MIPRIFHHCASNRNAKQACSLFLVVLSAKAGVRSVPAWLQPQAPRPELLKGSWGLQQSTLYPEIE